MTSTPLLKVTNLSKTFPGVRALIDVDLAVSSGEILALVGQNGSGKSTLVKALAGLHKPDAGGAIEVRDSDGAMLSAGQALSHLHFIHQDLGLIPSLSTVENLDIGHGYGSRTLFPTRRKAEARKAEALIASFGTSFDVRVPVADLLPAERTIVAIARALEGWTGSHHVLVLDEPTATLHRNEVDRLFQAVRRVADQGAGVIFISHRLDEVVDLADRVTVLRDGRVVADVVTGEFDHHELVELIVGRELSLVRVDRTAGTGSTVLSTRGLSGGTVDTLDLNLAAGEIVGLTGILGSGWEHVSGLIFGAIKRQAGEVEVDGRPVAAANPSAAVKQGIAFAPADRRAKGAVMDMSMRENLTLPRIKSSRRPMYAISRKAEHVECEHWIERVELRPGEPERALKLFSGGNQQKIVLAKWLRNEPKVLLLDEPTQGVDVGAKSAVYALVEAAAKQGAGVLVCSNDTKELALLCHRVLVMRDGVVVAELCAADITEPRMIMESLGLARIQATSEPYRAMGEQAHV